MPIDDEFIRKLFELMGKEYPDHDFGLGIDGFDIDIEPPHKDDKKIHRVLTISVSENDIEGIKEAIRILSELLPTNIEMSENNSMDFDESFTTEWE